ncbi:Gag-Pol [Cucumis melo var. makuwa]|uniref:Gag-Pol n=1 Tax=Cucumis melo var. makuwa TaxID=1194695 RepID=A0A5D3BP81_CUCMM|nr:Gag-Pol [Cucumis melo var. makuwa]
MFTMIFTKPSVVHVLGVVSWCMTNPGRDLDKSKSTTGSVFSDVASGAVTWVSRLQSVVAMSITEAKYVATTQASKEVV